MKLFKFNPAASTIYLTKSDALGHDPLTTTRQSRHTEGGGQLAENIHVMVGIQQGVRQLTGDSVQR
jgi:hypothetical protein